MHALYYLLQFFCAANEDDRNSVVVKVLQLLTVLIKYGYYDDASDVNALLPSIHKLLDGNKDYPSRQIKERMQLTLTGQIERRELELYGTSSVCGIVPLSKQHNTLVNYLLFNSYF